MELCYLDKHGTKLTPVIPVILGLVFSGTKFKSFIEKTNVSYREEKENIIEERDRERDRERERRKIYR